MFLGFGEKFIAVNARARHGTKKTHSDTSKEIILHKSANTFLKKKCWQIFSSSQAGKILSNKHFFAFFPKTKKFSQEGNSNGVIIPFVINY